MAVHLMDELERNCPAAEFYIKPRGYLQAIIACRHHGRDEPRALQVHTGNDEDRAKEKTPQRDRKINKADEREYCGPQVGVVYSY
jgi:hypothetical protein